MPGDPIVVPVPAKVIQAVALLNAVMPDLDRADVILLRDVLRHVRCLLSPCAPDKATALVVDGGAAVPGLADGPAVVRGLLECLFEGDGSQDLAFGRLSALEQGRVTTARVLARRWLAAVSALAGGGDDVGSVS